MRRRHSSACSEDGNQRIVSEADYDGDGEGEDSLYCSSNEDMSSPVSSLYYF